MHALSLVLITALIFVLAYRFYAAFIAARVLALNPQQVTPANQHDDGRDYTPTNRLVLFGHHFAAIAGAGPLMGPVLAAQFGYLPGFLWILIGAVLAGAVHDMVILFASVRHDGGSLVDIARQELGPFSGWITLVAILFLSIVLLAGASVSVVNALYNSPWGTFTVGLTIPIAIFIGIYLKWLRPGRIGEASIIGVALIIMAVLLGPVVQHSALASYFTFNKQQLSIIIVVYGFLGAVLPTWLLLVPRDYLSTYMKIGTMVMLAAGVILVNPVLKMPQTTVFINGGGPVIPGKVWPFIFVTVACGAISGWHALVSSGTTPKMVDSEADIKPIGYGAMLVEGFVAVMALIAATVLSPADYFAINSVPEVFARLGMHVQDLPELSRQIGENLAGRPGGAVTLAVGMASIFSSIGGLKHLMGYWYHFAIMFEALFILTLIDAGTRIGRYLLQAMGSHVYQPLRNNRWWPGVIASSAVFSLAWGYLLYGGDITTIWPLFGVNNQLLACMALAIGTTIIIKTERVKYVWVTLLPLLFLSVTAVDAAYQNIVINYLPKHDMVSAVISVVMLVLVVLVIIDAIRNWVKILTTRVNMNSTKDNQAL